MLVSQLYAMHSTNTETTPRNKLTKFDRLVLLGGLGLELGVVRLGLGELMLQTRDGGGGVFAVGALLVVLVVGIGGGLAFAITGSPFVLPKTAPFALAVTFALTAAR